MASDRIAENHHHAGNHPDADTFLHPMLCISTKTVIAAMVLAMGSLPVDEPIQAHEKPPTSKRDSVVSVAQSAVGWKEATGNNDGENIDRILASVGLKGTRNPYCAAFCVFCYQEAGFGSAIPRSGWSPDLVANPTWYRGRGETPRTADIFGIFFPSKNRVAHCGIIEKWANGTAVTIEGNTNPQADEGSEADRNGEGVCRRWRPTMTIYAVKSYL